MASSLLDQQFSLVSIVVLFSAVTALRIIPRFLPQQEDDGSIDVATRATEEREREGWIACLRSVRIVRAPPALPQPITTPPARPQALHSISNTYHLITETFSAIIQSIPSIFISSTDDSQSDNHTRRGVYSESDGFTHHGLSDRNLNVVIDTSVHPSGVDGGDT
ncbi:hypothetical protein IW261DRAFT_1656418 [Armillaria novae-zelandiae]|uniref:Uncharacterized protein n=1 Tax=Armillaria novae-zelandiae TaxID=153914 RepID=A0AA39NY49_9AGAR|nr:hypothetical protein IW261DRAFT_1656418 [Armillaria novae-zelandiae]